MNEFIDKLDYLQNLYVKTRESIVFLENYDKEKKSYIGPHNELRNALDHIMKMIRGREDNSVCEKEFKGAESHLLRAGYDAYELICISQIEYIKKTLAIYSTIDISIGFPDYYNRIRRDIVKIENETAKLREIKRQEGFLGKDTFEYYFEAAERLLKHVTQIDEHIPIINECYMDRVEREEQTQKPSKRGYIVGILGVIIGVIGIIAAIIK